MRPAAWGREVLTHELLVHDRAHRAGAAIACLEEPALTQAQAERLGIPWRDPIDEGTPRRRLSTGGARGHGETGHRRQPHEQDHRAGAGGEDAGRRPQALEGAVDEAVDTSVWNGRRQLHRRDQHAVGRVAGVHGHQPDETAREEAGAGNQDDGERRLEDEQRVRACAAPGRRGTRPPPTDPRRPAHQSGRHVSPGWPAPRPSRPPRAPS